MEQLSLPTRRLSSQALVSLMVPLTSQIHRILTLSLVMLVQYLNTSSPYNNEILIIREADLTVKCPKASVQRAQICPLSTPYPHTCRLTSKSGKEFVNPSPLQNHQKQHTQDKFECKQCGKQYKHYASLFSQHRAPGLQRRSPAQNIIVSLAVPICTTCDITLL